MPQVTQLRDEPEMVASRGGDLALNAAHWYERYVAEIGHAPRCADHLRAFAAHRGGHVPYSAARAIVESSASSAHSFPIDVAGSRLDDTRAGRPQAAATGVGSALRARQSQRFLPPFAPAAWTTAMEMGPSLSTSSRNGDHISAPNGIGRASGTIEDSRIQSRIRHLFQMVVRQNLGDAEVDTTHLYGPFQREVRMNPNDAVLGLVAALERAAHAAALGRAKRLLAALPVVSKEMLFENTECAICLEAAQDASADDCLDWRALPCSHSYHKECLFAWFKQSCHRSTCPLCRLDLDVALFQPLSNQASTSLSRLTLHRTGAASFPGEHLEVDREQVHGEDDTFHSQSLYGGVDAQGVEADGQLSPSHPVGASSLSTAYDWQELSLAQRVLQVAWAPFTRIGAMAYAEDHSASQPANSADS